MKPKVESLLAWLAFSGILILPVVVFLAISVPGKIAAGKQVTMDRARASLLAALSDIHAVGGVVALDPKQYGYFEVSPCTNSIVVGGSNYQCALVTSQWSQFANQGRLAVTTNREFIWLDYRRGPKIIPVDYRVSRWLTGY